MTQEEKSIKYVMSYEKLKGHLIKLNNTLIRTIGTGLANYFLYIVYDMDKEPKLVIVPPNIVLSNLETEVSLKICGSVYNKIKPEKLKKQKFT